MFIYGLVLKVSIVASLLFIWFQTNFIFYYYKLITGKNLDVPEEYTYPEYLYEKFKNKDRLRSFLGKLISCANCSGFILSLLICLDKDLLIVYMFSIIMYNTMRILALK